MTRAPGNSRCPDLFFASILPAHQLLIAIKQRGDADAVDGAHAADDAGADEVDEVEVVVFCAGDSAHDDNANDTFYSDVGGNTCADVESSLCLNLLMSLQKMLLQRKTRVRQE